MIPIGTHIGFLQPPYAPGWPADATQPDGVMSGFSDDGSDINGAFPFWTSVAFDTWKWRKVGAAYPFSYVRVDVFYSLGVFSGTIYFSSNALNDIGNTLSIVGGVLTGTITFHNPGTAFGFGSGDVTLTLG